MKYKPLITSFLYEIMRETGPLKSVAKKLGGNQ